MKRERTGGYRSARGGEGCKDKGKIGRVKKNEERVGYYPGGVSVRKEREVSNINAHIKEGRGQGSI